MTDCTARRYEFQGPGRRQFVASFDGGRLSSDGGAVLLREVDRQLDLIGRSSAACQALPIEGYSIVSNVRKLPSSGRPRAPS